MTINAYLSGPPPDDERQTHLMPAAKSRYADSITCSTCGAGGHAASYHEASSVGGVDLDDLNSPDVAAARKRFARDGTDDDGYDAIRDAGNGRKNRPMKSPRY